MKAPPFRYQRATSLEHACEMLAAHGSEARLLSGGQSLLASLAFRLSEPSLLIDIGRLDALRGVSRVGDRIRIGAATTHAVLGRDVLVREHLSLLADAVPLIAHAAIRNRGTIGGSLAYADPAAELPACAVALDAEVIVRSKSGTRRIPARSFFTGLLATALIEDELIEAVQFSVATAGVRRAITEIARRSGDYAMAGFAVHVRLDAEKITEARLIGFGIGEVPVLAQKAGAQLIGRTLDVAAITDAVAAVDHDLDPVGDLHGSAATKRHFARVVLRRALEKLATGKGTKAA